MQGSVQRIRFILRFAKLTLALLITSVILRATAISFDTFADSEVLTTQIPGLTFTNASVLTAGISLNEIEFPPHSNANVVGDNGSPIAITFASPISSFSDYFTYLSPLALQGFDGTSSLIASAGSSFASNLAISGDPGSSPNEFLHIVSSTPSVDVIITGDPNGGSFVMDDISFQSATAATPEPDSFALLVFAIVALFGVTSVVKRLRSDPIRSSQEN